MEHLDGPTACDLVQTCSKLATLLSYRERVQIRARPGSISTLFERARSRLRVAMQNRIEAVKRDFQIMHDNLTVCGRCGRSNHDYLTGHRSCGGGCKRSPYDKIIECGCGQVGTIRDIRPWRVTNDKMIPCFTCNSPVSMTTGGRDSEGNVYGAAWRCIACGIYCTSCQLKRDKPVKETDETKGWWYFF